LVVRSVGVLQGLPVLVLVGVLEVVLRLVPGVALVLLLGM
jgi:hypothetical protein